MAESIKSAISRRKYPRELDGAKNEWKALVDHYSEVGQSSDAFENRFDKTKKYLQAETLIEQQEKARQAKEQERHFELNWERNLVKKDLEAYERDRMQQFQKKRKLVDGFLSSNDALAEIRNKVRVEEQQRNRQLENNVLNREAESPDKNVLRALERIEKTKKIIADNKQLEDANYLYSSQYNSRSQQTLPHHSCKQGDIFDSLFERPAHWKNFYTNVVNTHQLNNISKHESNALQKDLMKNRELNHMVNQRITAYANELDSKSNKTIDEKRRLAQQYQTEISDIYRSIQNRKDNSKEMAKIGMIEKGAERIKANMELQRQLEEMEAFKREEQVKYRHLLDVQEKEQKKLDRCRMTQVEKKVNYDDLQDYKEYGKDIYTRAVPGIHSTVNPAMAKKVLTMFNKH